MSRWLLPYMLPYLTITIMPTRKQIHTLLDKPQRSQVDALKHHKLALFMKECII